MDIDALAGQVAPYVAAAVEAYGAAVLTRAEDAAAQGTVRIGQRILHSLLSGSSARPGVEQAVHTLASATNNPSYQAALRDQIKIALGQDGALAMRVATMIPRSIAQHTYVSASGSRSIATHSNAGVVSSGDGALNVGGSVSGDVRYHQGWQDPLSSVFKSAAEKRSRKAKILVLTGIPMMIAGFVMWFLMLFGVMTNPPDPSSPNFQQASNPFGARIAGIPQAPMAFMLIIFGDVLFWWGLVTFAVAFYRRRKANTPSPYAPSHPYPPASYH